MVISLMGYCFLFSVTRTAPICFAEAAMNASGNKSPCDA